MSLAAVSRAAYRETVRAAAALGAVALVLAGCGGDDGDASGSGTTTTEVFAPVAAITHCGPGHPQRPTATAFYVVGTVTNRGSAPETYVLWIAFKDQAGRVLYYSNVTTDVRTQAQPGATVPFEGVARSGTTPAGCEVACIDDVEPFKTPEVARCREFGQSR